MTARLDRLWPSTLAGRTMVVLLCSLFTLHIVSVWIHEAGVRSADRAARERSLVDGLGQAARALAGVPEAQRDVTAHTLSTPGLELHWRPQARVPTINDAGDAELHALRARVAASPALDAIRLGWGDAERHLLVGALPLSDEGQIYFAAPQFSAAHGTIFDTAGVIALVAVALGIGFISALVVRGLTRPLRLLARAADSVGRDLPPTRLEECGPTEVADAARAFNAMQERIRHLLEDRVQALSAVGHDLRTPLARLRLRTGFLQNADARERMEADINEMERMVEATIGYLREGRDNEPLQRADLAAMVRTLTDSAADAGATVTLDAPERMVLPLKRTAIRRAIGNLIENAGSHGGGTMTVSVRGDPDEVVIEVDDEGPGIPEQDLERVLDPFVRLDTSRSRNTGGVGLGLAIARRAVETCGGSLQLQNRDTGGLRACIRLKQQDPTHRSHSEKQEDQIL